MSETKYILDSATGSPAIWLFLNDLKEVFDC